MGSERASTTRKRLRGEICCACKRFITTAPPSGYKPGWRTGERYCEGCAVPQFIRCFMRYEAFFDAWRVDVTRDGKPIRSLTFTDSAKIMAMAKKGRGIRNASEERLLNQGIRDRRGSLEIYLTPEEFEKLGQR